ncbi:MAG: hypothetical protein RID59_10310 [Hoeflea sp.]
MAVFSRRSVILAMGLAAVVRDIFQPRNAHAYYSVENAEGIIECLTEGGKVTFFDEPKGESIGYCDTRDDLTCMGRLDNKQAYYHSESDTCRIVGDDDDEFDDLEECFLTTACVRQAGLSDCCFELRVLRAFRDGQLRHMPGGQDDIDRYYRDAPALVRLVSRHRNGRAELSRAYLLYVLPSAICAKIGFNRLAHWIYRRMMMDLPVRLSF